MQPIFETSTIFFRVKVYKTHVSYKFGFFGSETTIPVKQIASVDSKMGGVQEIILETTGGKKVKLLVRLRDKEALKNAIIEQISA